MPSQSSNLNVTDATLKLVYRRLRGYAFDPSFANRLDAFNINTIVYPVRWEENIEPGPIGEYLEVIDVDPASSVFYPPINLNDPILLAQDGLPPSESNPQFHQQMVYAVAMTTIQNFEKALGRPVLWSSRDYQKSTNNTVIPEQYVQRLRLYPHAIRDANAYYSSAKKAVLFGYFAARPSDESLLMPNSLVFTCLSHDIITHEVTHALIDGIHKGFIFPAQRDTLALHEAFSDLVALFQHFTFPEILESQIAKTRGELKGQNLLSELAQQFGLAVGNYSSLRNAIGQFNENGEWVPLKPNPKLLQQEEEAHGRGSILVAAVFDAFTNIYKKRTADLNRIASDGTGVVRAGELHPDLVKRLAYEASRTAKQFLSLCIRALDYCPPVGTTFGDFLRGIITADVDLVPNDQFGYRVAFIESFKRWGIYPTAVRTLSVENLTYYAYTEAELLGEPDTEYEDRNEKLNARPETYLMRKLDDLLLETDYLCRGANVLLTDEFIKRNKIQLYQAQADLAKLVTQYTNQILKQFTNLKNDLKTHYGLDYSGEFQFDDNLGFNSSSSLDPAPKTDESKSDEKNAAQWGNENTLLRIRYLAREFFNETANFLHDRKRLFELALEYKERFHFQLQSAPPPAKQKLQALICIALEENKYNKIYKPATVTEINTLLSDANLRVKRIYQRSMHQKNHPKRLGFEIHSLSRAQRVGPDTNVLNQVVLTLLQRFQVEVDDSDDCYQFTGGCTVIFDIDKKTVRFIQKGTLDPQGNNLDIERLAAELRRRYRPTISEAASPFALSQWNNQIVEPFALLHQAH